ncbi:MAG: 37kDa nucleoid-associated protein [Anaerosporomusa subterranea]|nr:37kDa nucleoid-associated protein [Anaerosporomusa subterranea]
MFDFSEIKLDKIVVHKVGNRLREEGYITATAEYELTNGNVEELLLKYFLSAFREKVVYKFFHQTDLHLNELYMYASNIFIDQSRFFEQSVNVLKHLYETSTHPQIKSGEFYMTYFSGCLINDRQVDAIGIFKTERKENYLKVSQWRNDFTIDMDQGINVRKLDKGCIIFNTDSQDGYRVAIVDTVNKTASEAVYWKDDFLRLTDVQDEYFHTQNHLNLCRDFAENVYGPLHQASKGEQVTFMNNAVAYFDKNQHFQLDDFVEQVVKEPELIEQFKEHKELLEMNQGLPPAQSFSISNPAVKSIKRKIKNLIKLDTDIEIKVKTPAAETSETSFIERGYDELKGMHYYKVFFNEEE